MSDQKIKIRIRAVIIQNDHILLAYHPERDFHFYIGGKMEFGETIVDAFNREIKEECAGSVEPKFIKILYIGEFLQPENGEHSLEFFVLGEIDKFKEVEQELKTDYDSHVFIKWVPLANLPANLKPSSLTPRLLADWQKGFPDEGEYIGRT